MAPGLAQSVRCDDERLYLTLTDGRIFSQPLTPRLRAATPSQRATWVVEDFGTAIHWPDLDEDVEVAHVLGIPEDEVYDFAGFTRGMPEE